MIPKSLSLFLSLLLSTPAVFAQSSNPSTEHAAHGNQQYALMMGAFATPASADALASALRAKTTENITVFVVKDMDNVPTWVVALGAFASVAEARAQTAPIATALQLRSPPLTIMLPNKP